MKTFLQPLMGLALLGCVFAIDTAITAAIAGRVIRAVAYGFCAVFLLLIVVIALLGV
jgi:hypothetical protein